MIDIHNKQTTNPFLEKTMTEKEESLALVDRLKLNRDDLMYQLFDEFVRETFNFDGYMAYIHTKENLLRQGVECNNAHGLAICDAIVCDSMAEAATSSGNTKKHKAHLRVVK